MICALQHEFLSDNVFFMVYPFVPIIAYMALTTICNYSADYYVFHILTVIGVCAAREPYYLLLMLYYFLMDWIHMFLYYALCYYEILVAIGILRRVYLYCAKAKVRLT